MPYVPVPINEVPNRNVSPEALDAEGDLLIDGYIDVVGQQRVSVKRPGLLEHLNLGLGANDVIDGLYWWMEKQYLIIVSGGRIFKLDSKTAIAATEITGVTVTSGVRPVFATDGDNLVISTTGKMVVTDGLVVTYYMTSPDAPLDVNYVIFFDLYFLANLADTAEVYHTEPNDIESWDPLNFFTAEGAPDNVAAVLAGDSEVYVLGYRSLEVYYNDGVTPFSRVGGGFIQDGTIAPKTARLIQGNLIFLNQNRKFVMIAGRTPQVLSTQYDKQIQGFSVVSDAHADQILVNGKTWYVVHFPTANKTLVYDYTMNYWAEWGYWNSQNNNGVFFVQTDRWIGNCYAYAVEWGMHFVGSRMDSKLFLMSADYYTDNGNTIRFFKRTGHISHGSGVNKRANNLLWKVKSGMPTTGPNTPVFMMRFKNDNRNQWSNEYQLSLKAQGFTNFFAKQTRMGMYRTRQYEIVHTDPVPFTLISAEEDIETLRI